MRNFLLLAFFSVIAAKSDQQLPTAFNCQGPNLIKVLPIAGHTFQHISYLETESWGIVACNGMVVLNGGEALVLDTPVDEKASEELLDWIESELKAKVVGVVATHFHEDCVGGLKAFHKRGISSYGIGKSLQLAKEAGNEQPRSAITRNRTFTVGSQPVQLTWFGAGHTQDNIVAYVPEDKVLFGGCLIKAQGAGKGNLADADPEAWPGTVQKIIEAYPDVEVVVPGHGDPGGAELLEYTVELFSN